MKTNLNSLKEFSDEKKFWVLTAVFVAVYERIKVWNKNELFLSPMWRFHKELFYIQTMWTCFIKSLLRSALGCYSQLLVKYDPFLINKQMQLLWWEMKNFGKSLHVKTFCEMCKLFYKMGNNDSRHFKKKNINSFSLYQL